MTILLTGGTGKTGLPLAHLLMHAGHPVLLACRSGKVPEPFKGVKFDWTDTTTHGNPFKVDPNIERVYLVCPETDTGDTIGVVKPWVEFAISKGVKRFVLLSSTALGRDAPFHTGLVHKYLEERGVDYAVLRPTWFIDNFGTMDSYVEPVRDSNKLPSRMENGRVPFVAAEDISRVAFRALTDERSHNTDHIIIGPDLHTFDEVAALFSEILGRTIEHKRLTDIEDVKFWMSMKVSEGTAHAMVQLEKMTAGGAEEAQFHVKVKEIGKVHLKDYIKANRELWIKSKKD